LRALLDEKKVLKPYKGLLRAKVKMAVPLWLEPVTFLMFVATFCTWVCTYVPRYAHAHWTLMKQDPRDESYKLGPHYVVNYDEVSHYIQKSILSKFVCSIAKCFFSKYFYPLNFTIFIKHCWWYFWSGNAIFESKTFIK
jgi:hypothetical protein